MIPGQEAHEVAGPTPVELGLKLADRITTANIVGWFWFASYIPDQ